MWVCMCKGVQDTTVADLVKAGRDTLKDIQVITGAGTGCGQCIKLIEQIITKEKSSEEEANL